MIHVAIADDHPVVRRGIKQMISLEGDMKLVVEAASAAELLQLLHHEHCDVLILDINLPDRKGLEILKDVWKEQPRISVLILSVYPPSQFAAGAIRAGVSGYLTKESAPEDLVEAIRTVVGGRRFITPATAEALASAIQMEEQPGPDQALSPRERQVLRLYCVGKTVTEIAASTGLSVRTVSTYKSRILAKLGFATNADLIAYAIRNNMTES